MTRGLLFTTDHPVMLRWTRGDGAEITKLGRLHRISESAVSVMLRQAPAADDALVLGERISAEAGDPRGECVAVLHGQVHAIESRLVKITVDGTVDVQDRRRWRRVQLPFCFATCVLLTREAPHYFLTYPIDIGVGGVRFSHRLPLETGDRFRLLLRLTHELTLPLLGEVIESWEQPRQPMCRRQAPTQISRAAFIGLLPQEQALVRRYVLSISNRSPDRLSGYE